MSRRAAILAAAVALTLRLCAAAPVRAAEAAPATGPDVLIVADEPGPMAALAALLRTRAGRGLLLYLQPGHTADDFRHPAFGQIVLNALAWEPGMEPEPGLWPDLAPGPDLAGWTERPWPPGSDPAPGRAADPWTWDPVTHEVRCEGARPGALVTEASYGDADVHLEYRYLGKAGGPSGGAFVRMDPDRRVMHPIDLAPGADPGAWQTLDVACRGARVTVRLGGGPGRVTDGAARGRLGLASAGRPIAFRHLRVREVAQP